jgi:hypothetical protein
VYAIRSGRYGRNDVPVTEHCLQYAIVIGLQFPYPPVVFGTEQMSDHEILRYLRDHRDGLKPHAQWKLTHSDLRSSAFIGGVTIQRVDYCIVCRTPSPCETMEWRARRASG